MRVNNVGLNLGQHVSNNNPFKTSRNSTTNPFQNVSFEGNTLPCADVFVGGIESKSTNKLKMIASSVAGSMTKLHSAFEPITKFVSRIGGYVSNAWTYAWNKSLFTLPGEETCRKVMNADIVDIGKGIGDKMSYLNKDIKDVKNDITGLLPDTTALGKQLGEKWNSIISGIKINHNKIDKNASVEDLKVMLEEELALVSGKAAA